MGTSQYIIEEEKEKEKAKAQFKEYIKALLDFDKEINQNYQKAINKKSTKDNGYLIDNKSFEDFKNKLFYEKFQSSNDSDFTQIIDTIFQTENDAEYITLEQKIFKTSKELVESLSNNDEYIIINSKTFEKINIENYNKNKGEISYEIKENELIINLRPGENAVFKHNFNIIKNNILLSMTSINAPVNPEDEVNEGKNNNKENDNNIINNNKREDSSIKLINNNLNLDENLIPIETLFELYLFNEELTKQLKDSSSKVVEGKCYLINEKWFSLYRDFYLYKEIYNDFKEINNKNELYSHFKQIYDKNKDNFNKNYNDINTQFPLYLKDNKYFTINFQLEGNENKIIFSDKYSVINENILNKIISPDFEKEDIGISQYYINNKKFIMNFKKNCIIIGELILSDNNYTLNPEILLEYYNEEITKNQLALFKETSNDIKNILDLKNEPEQEIKSKESKDILGKAFLFKKLIQLQLYNNKQIDIYIELLLRLLYNYEYINRETNKNLKEQQFETCYIVNKNYISKLKEILNYKEFCKLKIKEKYNIYFKELKNSNELIKNIKILEEIKDDLYENEILEILKTIDEKIINEIKKDDELIKVNKIDLIKEGLYYYKNFEIISNDLYEFLNKKELIPFKEKMIKSKCLYGEHKIILDSSFPEEKKSLIIINMNDNNEFIAEFILYYNISSLIDELINEIKHKGYKQTFSKLKFKDNEATIFKDNSNNIIGKAYKIIEKEELKLSREMEEEIFNLIRIYLFNLVLKINIDLSNNHVEGKSDSKNIFTEECYLINKDWSSEYKKYYLYNELYEYLNDKNIKDKLDLNSTKSYDDTEIEKIYEEIKNNANFFKEYYTKEVKIIEEKLIEPNELNIEEPNCRKIKYYGGFTLINSDLKNQLFDNKYKKNLIKCEYIINLGKILIEFSSLNHILISSLNIDLKNNEMNIMPSQLIYFEDSNELKSYYEKFKQIQFKNIMDELKKEINKIYDKVHSKQILALYNIDKKGLEQKENNKMNKIENQNGKNEENYKKTEDEQNLEMPSQKENEILINKGQKPNFLETFKREKQRKLVPLVNSNNQEYGIPFLLDNYSNEKEKIEANRNKLD